MPHAAKGRHIERHRIARTSWLRAGALGANDGLMSTASVMLGVATAQPSAAAVLTVGLAALVAGALSMAAGEYISVSSQSDTEAADLAREHEEHLHNPAHELDELAAIYEARGLDPVLARDVAKQLTEKDALAAHARDELGITDTLAARPLQAALVSAAAFAGGAAVPVAVVMAAPRILPGFAVTTVMSVVCLIALTALGAFAARLGGASKFAGARRSFVWSAIAMGVSALIGRIAGVAI